MFFQLLNLQVEQLDLILKRKSMPKTFFEENVLLLMQCNLHGVHLPIFAILVPIQIFEIEKKWTHLSRPLFSSLLQSNVFFPLPMQAFWFGRQGCMVNLVVYWKFHLI